MPLLIDTTLRLLLAACADLHFMKSAGHFQSRRKARERAELTPFSQKENESLLADLIPMSLLQSERSAVSLSRSLGEKPQRFHVYGGKRLVEIWLCWAEGQEGRFAFMPATNSKHWLSFHVVWTVNIPIKALMKKNKPNAPGSCATPSGWCAAVVLGLCNGPTVWTAIETS